MEEELKELKRSIHAQDSTEIVRRRWDLYFSLVNVCRYLDINPEHALNTTTDKFVQRFKYIEQQARLQGKALHSMSLEEMDRLG